MTRTVLVVNPNASPEVTAGIDNALMPLRAGSITAIECHALNSAPKGIQRESDILTVMPLLIDFIRCHEQKASAFVIACFSDPGLHAAREATVKPVLGIGESAMLTAMTCGDRIGVVAIQPASIPRHLRAWRSMGIASRLAGERALGLDVAALASDAQTWRRLLQIGRTLRDEDRADALVLGCAGLARFQEPLADALSLPVIEPCRAATGMALTAALTR